MSITNVMSFGIVNGKVTPHTDNFTYVSVKGKAVMLLFHYKL